MRRHDRTEVLVAGAGPVGLFTALRLAGHGVAVQLIDQEPCTAGRSYACALHPRTLQLLDEVGLAHDAIRLGQRIDTVAFYEGGDRRAELDLSVLPVPFPFVLVLEQSILEDLLEQRLQNRGDVKVNWNHRLADIKPIDGAANATIEKLALDVSGYAVPDIDLAVRKTISDRANFVIGTDGRNSVVRQRLDIECELVGDPELYVVYELETADKILPEMRVVLNGRTTSVLWPFAENRCRWSFQWFESDGPRDFPQKERDRFTFSETAGETETRNHLQQLLSARAPWFQTTIKNIGWAADIQFQPQLARQFGRGRTWLAGDAAHQTGPVGMQSMNIGFREGADLADKLAVILRENGSPDLLSDYNRECRTEWERLLGLNGVLTATNITGAWFLNRRGKIPSCIPASGKDLTILLRQLGLEFDPLPRQEAQRVLTPDLTT